MTCWNCGSEIDLPLGKKIAFRAECEHCHHDLHCCASCKYYKPGMKNDCMVPGVDLISDKTKRNLCEEYVYTEKKGSFDKKAAFKKFDDLFK